MAIKHGHKWELRGTTMWGDHFRCADCLMVKARILGGWGYRCSGDVGVGMFDNETDARLNALQCLDKLVSVPGARPPLKRGEGQQVTR